MLQYIVLNIPPSSITAVYSPKCKNQYLKVLGDNLVFLVLVDLVQLSLGQGHDEGLALAPDCAVILFTSFSALADEE